MAFMARGRFAGIGFIYYLLIVIFAAGAFFTKRKLCNITTTLHYDASECQGRLKSMSSFLYEWQTFADKRPI